MQNGDRTVFAFTLLLAAGFGVATLKGVYTSHMAERAKQEQRVLKVAPAVVIGPRPTFEGDVKSPFTLVEFGDYQCPPCRKASQQLPGVLQRYKGQLRLTFRNRPIPPLHPLAMSDAIIAEAIREQGQFWAVHDVLFQKGGMVNSSIIQDLIQKRHIDATRFERARITTAKKAVLEDVRRADALKMDSTPGFFLCCPDNRVIRLTSLDQLSLYLPASS